MEDGARRTQDGVATVEQARESFLALGSSVSDMNGRVDQIAAAIQQIAASSAQVQADIGEVAAVAEESSASTEEVSASTEQTSASTQQIARVGAGAGPHGREARAARRAVQPRVVPLAHRSRSTTTAVPPPAGGRLALDDARGRAEPPAR